MAEIELKRRVKYAGDVHAELLKAGWDCCTAAEFLNNIPDADVAPVRHGRWEEMHYEGGILDGTNFDRCSICGYERVFDNPALKTVFKYCPNCGAKMDRGADR